MNPQITLLMPCYNGMKYIAAAVESARAQSMTDWELLISDDGSKDGTIEYLSGLRDDRIKVVIQPKNLGIFGNLNFLFSRARAPVTQILCQDDYLLGGGALAQILALWSELPADVAFLRCNHGRDGTDGLMPLEIAVLPRIVDPATSDLFFFVFGCIPGNLSNVSVRTPLVAQAGGFRTDLPFAGDFEFWSRLGRDRPWAIDRSHVVQIRRHLEQASTTLNRHGELLPQLRDILEGLHRRLLQQGFAESELRFAATVLYLVRHFDGALKEAWAGTGWGYLRLVDRVFVGTECFLGRTASWALYVLTVGGRHFGAVVARRLLRRHITPGWMPSSMGVTAAESARVPP